MAYPGFCQFSSIGPTSPTRSVFRPKFSDKQKEENVISSKGEHMTVVKGILPPAPGAVLQGEGLEVSPPPKKKMTKEKT